MRPSQIPPPVQGDHEDVRWALSTAASLEAAGDQDEALRWLRRAVASAVASDDDVRAIELGRIAAELEERLAGAATQRGHEEAPATEVEATAAPAEEPRRIQDTTPDLLEDEVTVVPFTMKAAGLDAAEVLRARRIASKTLRVDEIPLGRPTSDPPAARSEVPAGAVTLEESARFGSTQRSSRARSTFDDEPTFASRPVAPASVDRAAVSSSTLPALTRWRVALLAAADDDQPRVLYLGPGVDPPAGAAVCFLVPSSDEDARMVAELLRRRH